MSVFGDSGGGHSLGWYENTNGDLALGGQHGNGYFYGPAYNHTYNNYRSTGDPGLGVFLVSDGGTTYSSINNPGLNVNNLNAPVNNAIDVPEPTALALFAMSGILFMAGRKKKS